MRARRHIILPIAMWSAAVAGCRSAPIDPTANIPLRPAETAQCGETPPDALAPAFGQVPLDERAPHTATRIEVSKLSCIERTLAGEAIIKVRLDAFDAGGAAGLLAGDLRVVLKTERADPCFLAFDAPLATKRQVLQHTDQTLGQVVVLLDPEWRQEPARGERVDLTATFTSLDGKVIESVLRLTW